MQLTVTEARALTPEQFLKMEPHDHPDFVYCGEIPDGSSRRQPTVLMPNLVALIQRMGGIENVPDRMERTGSFDLRTWHHSGHAAMLRDRSSHLVYGSIDRLGDDCLDVSEWHPHDYRPLPISIIFGIPPDWTVSPWTISHVSMCDVFSTTTELDLLASRTCDFWFAAIQKSTDTYIHIQRDQFLT
jgi:hypothetical protein